MNFTNSILMVFPLVFVIHSLIELFLLKPWLNKNRLLVSGNNSDFTKGTLSIFKKLSTKCLAFIAFEEFMIISLASAYGMITENYYPWIALLCGFSLHLTIHIANWMAYMRYIPSIITTFISASFCIFALDYIIHGMELPIIKVVVWGISGAIFSSINLYLLIRISIFLRLTKLKIQSQK